VITNLGMAKGRFRVAVPDRVTITRSTGTLNVWVEALRVETRPGDHRKAPIPVEGFQNAAGKRSLTTYGHPYTFSSELGGLTFGSSALESGVTGCGIVERTR
jgi:hypothetical protein